jgi:hypothetical protein
VDVATKSRYPVIHRMNDKRICADCLPIRGMQMASSPTSRMKRVKKKKKKKIVQAADRCVAYQLNYSEEKGAQKDDVDMHNEY